MVDEKLKNKKGLDVIISNKVRKGSVKVSDKDLPSLQVGIVDDVFVTKVGGNESVTEMLFSDSKVQSGVVLLNVNDALVIGVEEGDKVTIEKQANNAQKKEIKPETIKKMPIQEPSKDSIENPVAALNPNLNPDPKTSIKKTENLLNKN